MKIELNIESDFIDVFTKGGSSTVDCQCGRHHVAMRSYDAWDDLAQDDIDDMILGIEEEAASDEGMVLNYDADSIGVMEIGSVIFAEGCECEGWKPYMEFMVNQRGDIAEFILRTQIEYKRMVKHHELIDMLKAEYE